MKMIWTAFWTNSQFRAIHQKRQFRVSRHSRNTKWRY